ncbi:MAG TPA: hypothetical protein ENG49_05230, partial [Candidatus Omnitrophica bacterium]|nr:hypothetical protein [Candidatus Omnitrophota bacterium]
SFRIKEAEKEKIPYIIVIGEREKNNNTLNVRTRGRKVLGEMRKEEFLEISEVKEFLKDPIGV